MGKYKARHIQFKELVEVHDWKVKIYTITEGLTLDHSTFYKNVLGQLDTWLEEKNSFNSKHESAAFLILHVGREGIFSLINWWIGDNMLNTNVYLSNPEEPEVFTKISGDGLGPCVWELDIMHHESTAWLKNMLMDKTDLNSYLEDVLIHKVL